MQMKTEACFVAQTGRAARWKPLIPAGWVFVFSKSSGPPLTSCVCFTRRRMPSLLEYLSYNCNFMGILAGPLCSYRDYITFIEGRAHHRAPPGTSGKEDVPCERAEPSPNVSS